MSGSEYYDHTTYPSQGSQGSSSSMRAELDLIESGFGKLPDLTGNGSKIVAVNSGATALEAIATTGTGNGVRATSPTLTTPTLGVAAATSINKVAITTPATGATLTIADGKTLTASNTITLVGTDSSTLNIGSGGTLVSSAYSTIGVAKAWINASGDGTTINASHNVSSISDDGLGVLTVTIDTDFSSTNYVIAGMIQAFYNYNSTINAITAGSFRVISYNSSSVTVDPTNYLFVCFGT